MATKQMNRHGFAWPDAPTVGEDTEKQMASLADELSGILDGLQGKVAGIQDDPHLNVPGKQDRLLTLSRETHAATAELLERKAKTLQTAREDAEQAVEQAIAPKVPSVYTTSAEKAAAADRADAEIRADMRAFAAAHPIDSTKLSLTTSGAIAYKDGDPVGVLLDAARSGDLEHGKRTLRALRGASPVLRSLLGGDQVVQQMRRDVVKRAAPEQQATLDRVSAFEVVVRMYGGHTAQRIQDLTGMNPRQPNDDVAQIGTPAAE